MLAISEGYGRALLIGGLVMAGAVVLIGWFAVGMIRSQSGGRARSRRTAPRWLVATLWGIYLALVAWSLFGL